jgi:hypothetical protein
MEKLKISFGGFPPKEVCLMFDPSAISWFALMALIFLGRVFGKLRFL